MHAINGYRQIWMTSLFRQSDVYLNAAMFASDRTSPLERVMVQGVPFPSLAAAAAVVDKSDAVSVFSKPRSMASPTPTAAGAARDAPPPAPHNHHSDR